MAMKVLEKKSLDEVLLKVRNQQQKQSEVLEKVGQVLHQHSNCLSHASEEENTTNAFQLELLNVDRIFHKNQIQKICVDYRLRFLPTKLFKHGLPDEAIDAWMALEALHQTSIRGLQIAAPSKSFHLKTYDDPMLFAPIGNDYYYLIHKWGNDVSPLRKWKYWPVKNVITFLLLSVFVSALLTFILPMNKLGTTLLWAPFIVFLFMFKSIVGTVAYYFFMMGKNFNSEIWDRPFKEN
ncbi:MAG: hypothetical protein RLZZ500_1085 [Bacteroidota bacterium]